MKGFEDIIVTDESEEVKKTPLNKSVHVAFIMDHSGSMTVQRRVALENFNEQIETLKRNSKDNGIHTWVSLIEFDDRIQIKHEGILINDIEPEKDYWTGGTTSLNDAIFRGIKLLEKELNTDLTEDKSALMIIMTDGYENSSKEFVGDKGRNFIKKEIKRLEKTDLWTFTFMGADMDVQNIAVEGYGMKVGNIMSFAGTGDGYKMSGNSVKNGMNDYYRARNIGSTNVNDFHDNTGDVDLNSTNNTLTDEEDGE